MEKLYFYVYSRQVDQPTPSYGLGRFRVYLLIGHEFSFYLMILTIRGGEPPSSSKPIES